MYKKNNITENIIGDIVIDKKYEKIAEFHKPDEKKMKNAIMAFLSGGVVGFMGELFIEIVCNIFLLSRSEAGGLMIITLIFFASLFTALGFFDRWVNLFRCGLLIPITGFAHSMTSSILDYKREGPVYGMGSNVFKLAGSVILYGVVSAVVFGTIRYLIGG